MKIQEGNIVLSHTNQEGHAYIGIDAALYRPTKGAGYQPLPVLLLSSRPRPGLVSTSVRGSFRSLDAWRGHAGLVSARAARAPATRMARTPAAFTQAG